MFPLNQPINDMINNGENKLTHYLYIDTIIWNWVQDSQFYNIWPVSIIIIINCVKGVNFHFISIFIIIIIIVWYNTLATTTFIWPYLIVKFEFVVDHSGSVEGFVFYLTNSFVDAIVYHETTNCKLPFFVILKAKSCVTLSKCNYYFIILLLYLKNIYYVDLLMIKLWLHVHIDAISIHIFHQYLLKYKYVNV